MWNLVNMVGSFLRTANTPAMTLVRFYERRRFVRRYGYREHYHCRGLLPRIKEENIPLRSIPNEPKSDPWNANAALFGQNDYIDILGDDKINPTQLMSSVPQWLRKFRGNEMQMLIRRRVAKAHWKWSRPQKWDQLNRRIDFLYKRLNYKTAPRRPEY